MLFKRETDYGIRIVRALKEGEKIPVKSICEEEDIPEAFAYKILKKMQKNGIVFAERGAQGGYMLAKGLDKITLYDIILALDPDFSLIPCMNQACSRNTTLRPCAVHRALGEIQGNVIKELSAKSMKVILEE